MVNSVNLEPLLSKADVKVTALVCSSKFSQTSSVAVDRVDMKKIYNIWKLNNKQAL